MRAEIAQETMKHRELSIIDENARHSERKIAILYGILSTKKIEIQFFFVYETSFWLLVYRDADPAPI